MEILFVGVACTDEAIKDSNKRYYNNKATVRPQQYFDLNLVEGLSKHANIKAISEPPVASYPKSRCLLYHRREDIVSESLSIKYINLLNIFGIKTIIITINILLESLKFCIKNRKEDKVILLGYLSFYTSLPAIIISKIFNIKIFVMVPDIPKYASGYTNKKGLIRNIFSKILNKLNKLTESNFDGYILLTKYMNELVNKKEKPYIIMEGFFNMQNISEAWEESKKSGNIVMYAGTLHEKFGIKRLVEAFKLLGEIACELWIFGEGDYRDEIQQISHEYKNIKYKGIKDKDEILKLEREVTLLVNPRPTDEEFTKYSFPSKTLEYMASGTPLLTTKLKGIPKEYYDYIYLFEDEDIEEMAIKIKSILLYNQEELDRFGSNARKFVFKEKNHKIQTKAIIDFIYKEIRK